jgi:thiosulfate dehydrogenase [quinone] large subunit
MATNENKFTTELFGREFDVRYDRTATGYAMVALRLVMGWALLYPGINHLTALGGFEQATAGTIEGAATTAANPFAGYFAMLLPHAELLALLNAVGLAAAGAALMLGAFTRLAGLAGALMMLNYWAAALPLQHSIVVDSHVVYALILFGLGALGAGRMLGLDAVLERTRLGELPGARYLLG